MIEGLDWAAMLREATVSPLGIVSLTVIVMMFVILGIGNLTSFQSFIAALSVVLLVGLYGYLVIRAPIAPVGSSVCLIRNTTLTRNSHVELPGGELSIRLLTTHLTNDGVQPVRGGVAINDSGKKSERHLAESRAEELILGGRAYHAEVSRTLPNTIVFYMRANRLGWNVRATTLA